MSCYRERRKGMRKRKSVRGRRLGFALRLPGWVVLAPPEKKKTREMEESGPQMGRWLRTNSGGASTTGPGVQRFPENPSTVQHVKGAEQFKTATQIVIGSSWLQC